VTVTVSGGMAILSVAARTAFRADGSAKLGPRYELEAIGGRFPAVTPRTGRGAAMRPIEQPSLRVYAAEPIRTRRRLATLPVQDVEYSTFDERDTQTIAGCARSLSQECGSATASLSDSKATVRRLGQRSGMSPERGDMADASLSRELAARSRGAIG
jgi:hypothetical protein